MRQRIGRLGWETPCVLHRIFRMKPWANVDWWLFASAILLGGSIATLVVVLFR